MCSRPNKCPTPNHYPIMRYMTESPLESKVARSTADAAPSSRDTEPLQHTNATHSGSSQRNTPMQHTLGLPRPSHCNTLFARRSAQHCECTDRQYLKHVRGVACCSVLLCVAVCCRQKTAHKYGPWAIGSSQHTPSDTVATSSNTSTTNSCLRRLIYM